MYFKNSKYVKINCYLEIKKHARGTPHITAFTKNYCFHLTFQVAAPIRLIFGTCLMIGVHVNSKYYITCNVNGHIMSYIGQGRGPQMYTAAYTPTFFFANTIFLPGPLAPKGSHFVLIIHTGGTPPLTSKHYTPPPGSPSVGYGSAFIFPKFEINSPPLHPALFLYQVRHSKEHEAEPAVN